ncbi:MAG: hypothetical protein K0S74_1279 [Chlamydiales bacterium]|jgi:preprotein translocase subunit SecG|nr:hypothetical protein [Chlamydiales bacterium]
MKQLDKSMTTPSLSGNRYFEGKVNTLLPVLVAIIFFICSIVLFSLYKETQSYSRHNSVESFKANHKYNQSESSISKKSRWKSFACDYSTYINKFEQSRALITFISRAKCKDIPRYICNSGRSINCKDIFITGKSGNLFKNYSCPLLVAVAFFAYTFYFLCLFLERSNKHLMINVQSSLHHPPTHL